ncbi:MAG TPA: TolC family protein [Polyangiaceae bacterium]
MGRISLRPAQCGIVTLALVWGVATEAAAAPGTAPAAIVAPTPTATTSPAAVGAAGVSSPAAVNAPASQNSVNAATGGSVAAAGDATSSISPGATTTVKVVEGVTLDQAIERALRRNPSAQAAALEIDRAEALVRQARAASLPSLTGNVTYTRLDADRVFGVRTVAAKDQLNANLVLSVPLIAPARWAQWSHAKDDSRTLVLSGNEVRRQLAISVARTFLTVLSQHRVVEVNERALVTAVAHERYANERLSGGVGKRIDAVRASQQVATTTASVERAKVALARSREALGVLLGEEHPVDTAVEPELASVLDGGAAAATSSQRLDVQVAHARRAAAERRFNDSWLDFLPQLVGQFQPFYQTPASLTTPTTGWQAMLVLTVPLYEGGARYGARDERRALRDQADLQVANLLRQARSEIRIGFEAQKGAETALAAAQSAAQMAHDAEKMSSLAYEAGASTNLEVIDAERQARDADTEVAVAEDTLRQTRLDLLIASGRFPTQK